MQLTSYLQSLVATGDSFAATALRLSLGVMMLPHGLQKTFGWFGGYGFEGTMGYLTGTVGAPWIFAFLAILAESVGAVMLIVGFGTRLGNGCTSGHGICGLARLSRRSLVAVLAFMASGIATVYLLRHVLAVLP